MSVLPSARHERFAQEQAKGKSADEAYKAAGYKAHSGNAARLSGNERVRSRVAEIQSRGADKAAVTIESLSVELEEARAIAITQKQPSAAVAATMGKAKLFGLIVENHRHAGPNGGPIPTVDLTNLSDADIQRLEAIFGPLAGGAGNDDEGDPGGKGTAGG